MTNGFYNSDELSKKLKRAFIKDAIDLSYNIRCESKYSPTAPFTYRGLDKRLSLKSSIEWLFNQKDSTLVCVDRYLHGQGVFKKEDCEYEITFHTGNGPNNGWLLLYIFVNEESFNTLIKKYNLKQKEW